MPLGKAQLASHSSETWDFYGDRTIRYNALQLVEHSEGGVCLNSSDIPWFSFLYNVFRKSKVIADSLESFRNVWSSDRDEAPLSFPHARNFP